METQELHRGRLIDHIQLVVADLKSQQAILYGHLQSPRYSDSRRSRGLFLGR